MDKQHSNTQRTIRWAIAGTGKIAHKFAEGLRQLPEAQLVAVASRTYATAQAFAQTWNVPQVYDSFEALATDNTVDVVYIATPNSEHHANALLFLNHKKAVLCEKPFALNSAQLQEIVECARRNKVFLMEALWTRFLPTIRLTEDLIAQGKIGTPTFIAADFGFEAAYNPESRLFNPALGGGSLLDIGLYPAFLALLLFGKPDYLQAMKHAAPTGVDMTTLMQMRWNDGRVAQLSSTFAVRLPCEAEITGTLGSIKLHRMWHIPTKVSLRTGDELSDVTPELIGNGYNYEAQHVHECLQAGLTESPLLPLSFSLELMQLLDRIAAEK